MTDSDPLVEADSADLAEQRQGVGGGADATLPSDSAPDAPAGRAAARPADVGGTTPIDVVNEARNAGVLKPSLTAPTDSPANSSPGPTRRRVKRIAARSVLRPPGPPNGGRKDNRGDAP